METCGRTQDGNSDRSGEDVNENSNGVEDGDKDLNEDRKEKGSGEGGGQAKIGKKAPTPCRRDMGNEGDLGGKKKT